MVLCIKNQWDGKSSESVAWPMGHGVMRVSYGLWVMGGTTSHGPWVMDGMILYDPWVMEWWEYRMAHGSWVVWHCMTHGSWVVWYHTIHGSWGGESVVWPMGHGKKVAEGAPCRIVKVSSSIKNGLLIRGDGRYKGDDDGDVCWDLEL